MNIIFLLFLCPVIILGMAILSGWSQRGFENDSEDYKDDSPLGYRKGRGNYNVSYIEGNEEKKVSIEGATSQFDSYQKFLFKGSKNKQFIKSEKKS